jgi:hypothetical protein
MNTYAITIWTADNRSWSTRIMQAERIEDLPFNHRMPDDVVITVVELTNPTEASIHWTER